MQKERLKLFQVLAIIRAKPNITSVELIRELGITQILLDHHIQTLLAKGFVERDKNPNEYPFTSLYRYRAVPIPIKQTQNGKTNKRQY